ncbi:MAG TPA: cupredoxin domain-containing protein, partial [Bacteroidia bacterium]|nr:cupredoxin domain-containing protein [Bacteroidia bacterium]
MKKDFFAILILFLLSIGASFIFYQCKKTPNYTTNSNGSSTQSANEIWIQNMSFNPASLTVKTNTTVKWTNKDGTVHTVTSTTGAFDSGNLD